MIQVIATNLTQSTTKDKCEEENIKLGFTEYLPFSRNQTLNQLSGDFPLVQLTFTIEEDGLIENEAENKYVIDNSYMLLANNVKEVIGDFLVNQKHYNYDTKSTMMPISFDGFNQETDAKILSIRFYPRKFRQDQLLCRCFVIVPEPFSAEDMSFIEQTLHKKINNIDMGPVSLKQDSQETVIKIEKNEERLPEELSSVKIDKNSGNSFDESMPVVLPQNDVQNNNANLNIPEAAIKNNEINDDEDINIDALIDQKQSSLNQNKQNSPVVSDVIDENEFVIGEDDAVKTAGISQSLLSQTKSDNYIKEEEIKKEPQSFNRDNKASRLNNKISQYLEFMSYFENNDEDNEDEEEHYDLSFFNKKFDDYSLNEEKDEEPENVNASYIFNTATKQKDDTSILETISESKTEITDTSLNNKQQNTEINSDFNLLDSEEENIVDEFNDNSEAISELEVANKNAVEKIIAEPNDASLNYIKQTSDNVDSNIKNKDKDEVSTKSFVDSSLFDVIGNNVSIDSVLDKLNENKELFIDIKDNLAEYKTVSKKEVLNEAFSRVVKFFKTNERSQVVLAQKDEAVKKELIGDIERHIDNYISEIPNDDKTLLISMVKRALFSYYILTPLINDNTISDIKVLAPDKINIKKNGIHYTVNNLTFIDEADYKSFVDNLVERYQVPINSMFLVFSDIDFNPDYRLRFNISLPFVNSTGLPYVHIRKVPKNKLSLTDLIDAKMMTPEIALYLIDAMRNKSVLISGPSASGKTNLANALIDVIPFEQSGLVIQESEELFSDKHPNLMFQHMTKNCDLEALGTNGLLCDAGYFIIGEIKGKEARNFSKAAATGHKCMATIHASSSAKSIDRLVDYIRLGDKNYTTEDSLRLIQDMNVLVFVKDFKIQEIDEVIGIHENGQELVCKPIYRYNSDATTK